MKTKNGHILTFSEKMQISAILCFATCDWFCPMTSHISIYENIQRCSIKALTNWLTKIL